jgi:hypothetical protein
MGLLDALNSRDGIFALGLLDAASPRPVRTSLGGGLLAAMQGAQRWQQDQEDRATAAEERKRRAEMQALQQQLTQAQIGETQAQAQQRAAAAAQAQQLAARQQQFQQALTQLSGTTPQQALAGGGGPTLANAARLGQQQPINWQALAAQFPEQVDHLKKLAEAGDWGRAEVARTVDGRDAQGRPVTIQFDRFGNAVGAPVQQWKAPERIDTGGQLGMLDPVTMQVLARFQKSNTPDAMLSAATTRRGQDMTDARSREKNAIDANAVGKVEWKQDVNGNWIALPKEVSGSGPVTPVMTTVPGKREQMAQNALGVIDQAKVLLDRATGSYAGAGVDQAARVFGVATPGAETSAQLKALEGALMMAQPRMEGPQSDKDVMLYRQMAGQIGDSTVPASQKRAAIQVIEQLHRRYAGPGGASGSWDAAPARPAAGGVKFLGFE